MVHYKNWIILAAMVFTLIAFIPSAQAGPPAKPGNPGLPGCLAKVDQLEATIVELQGQIDTLNASLKYKLPKTGQKNLGYDWMKGYDGLLQLGMAWPIPRFTDNGDETVTDNLTNLVWTKNLMIFGWQNWYTALDSCYNMPGGWRLPNRNELLSVIDLNYDSAYEPGWFWHGALPKENPFVNITGDYYWTSSSAFYNFNCTAWAVSMGDGSLVQDSQAAGQNRVWCVRDLE